MEKQVLRDIDSGKLTIVDGAKAYYEKSWAVVIGINRYVGFRPLEFAVADAVAIAETLISKRGFLENHVFLVLDPPEKVPSQCAAWLENVAPRLGHYSTTATKSELEEILLTTLPSMVGPDDRVLVYFAGHGTLQNMPGGSLRDAAPYLVPANSKPGQWHTYVDLYGLARQSASYHAKHIFFLLDACSSGQLGLMRGGDPPTRFEQDMLQRRARQCLTAGTGEQLVEDHGVSGHSTFTHHLLQVLGGAVRLGDDELVTASNLTAYIKRNVAGNAYQTPDGFPIVGHLGGEFIFYAPKASLGLEERCTLARLLVDEVGVRLQEPSPVELGADLWEKIVTTKPTSIELVTTARCAQARALLALGRAGDALPLLEGEALRPQVDADFLRGIAYLKTRKLEAARTSLDQIAADPDHPYSTWARAAAEAAGKGHSKRYALLVGVGKYAKNPRLHLRGCENDVRALSEVLRTRLGFDVALLLDEAATSDSIVAAFRKLADTARPEDSFIFYFSGNGFLHEDDVAFASHDCDRDAQLFITEHQIDACMNAIPARDKLLVTDGCHLAPTSRNPPTGYRYLFGCSREEVAYENFTEGGVARGAFTYELEQALSTYGNAPLEQLIGPIAKRLAAARSKQTPGYTGDGSATFVRDYHPAFEVIDLATRGSCGQFSTNQLADLTSWMRANHIAAKPLWLSIGRAWLARRRCEEAVEALTTAGLQDASLPLVKSQLLLDRYGEALASLRSLIQQRGNHLSDADLDRSLADLEPLLERMSRPSGHALLVGIGAETSKRWTSDPSAQLTAIYGALIQAGFPQKNVKIIHETRSADLLTAFDAFIARAGEEPAFFVFIGPGFDDAEIWLSTADKAKPYFSDLPLSKLRERAAACKNLASAIFLTQRRGPYTSAGANTAAAAPAGLAGLGSVTIVATPPKRRDIDVERPSPPEVAKLLGALEAYAPHSLRALSGKEWLTRAGFPDDVTIRGDSSISLFSPRHHRHLALELHRRIEHAPLRLADALLTKLTEDHALAARAWLHRGVVRAELGRHAEALDDIEAALERYRADHAAKGEVVENGSGVVRWADAHYHRGRILLEARRYSEAEAALATAVDQDKDHARAHYYHARAIRRLIEANLEQRARDAAQRYIALGAPLGLDEDVETLVTRRVAG